MEKGKEALKEKEKNCELQKESPLNLNGSCNTKDWQSVSKESFLPPENVQERVGKRKTLLKKYFQLQAAKEMFKEETGNVQIVRSFETEYIENFCDLNFKPFVDNTDYDINKQIKYPLYGGETCSIYNEQVNRGQLKTRSSISDFKQPFRKSTSFTTPPEFSLYNTKY